MPRFDKRWLLASCLMIAAAFAQADDPVDESESPRSTRVEPGEQRPSFALRDLEGRYRDISEWDGKLIFVNFWATWCPPCLHEIPVFISLQEQYAEAGVQFLGVALDNRRDVQRFSDKIGMNYPTLYGAQEAVELSKAYGNPFGGLPYTVVIGRDGVVIHTHPGVLQRDKAQALIRDAR